MKLKAFRDHLNEQNKRHRYKSGCQLLPSKPKDFWRKKSLIFGPCFEILYTMSVYDLIFCAE